MYVFCGPFINITVLLYASYYMDSFGWGKTRRIIAQDPAKVTEKSSSQEDEQVDTSSADPTSDPIAAGEAPVLSTIEIVGGVNVPPQQSSGTTSSTTFDGSSFERNPGPDDIAVSSSTFFPLHADTEKLAGLEHEAQPATRALDIIAVLGSSPGGDSLLDRFGRHYCTIAFDATELEVDRLRTCFSGEAYTVEVTSDVRRLATADVFVVNFDPSSNFHSPEPDLLSEYARVNAMLECLVCIARQGSSAVIESGPGIELNPDLLALEALDGAGILYSFAMSAAHSNVNQQQLGLRAEELHSTTILATSQRACGVVGQIYQRMGLEVRTILIGDGEQECCCSG